MESLSYDLGIYGEVELFTCKEKNIPKQYYAKVKLSVNPSMNGSRYNKDVFLELPLTKEQYQSLEKELDDSKKPNSHIVCHGKLELKIENS